MRTLTMPSGVTHISANGRDCDTCGRQHFGVHGRHAAGECEVAVWRGAYPYPCTSQDRHPDAMIATCAPHNVWWRLDDDGTA